VNSAAASAPGPFADTAAALALSRARRACAQMRAEGVPVWKASWRLRCDSHWAAVELKLALRFLKESRGVHP